MDRRSFLRFLGIAPVAAPLVAKELETISFEEVTLGELKLASPPLSTATTISNATNTYTRLYSWSHGFEASQQEEFSQLV